MQSLLDRRLIVVTGKGGVGKTTIAGALGMLAASRGLRTLVVDASGASLRLRQLFAAGAQQRAQAEQAHGGEQAPEGAPESRDGEQAATDVPPASGQGRAEEPRAGEQSPAAEPQVDEPGRAQEPQAGEPVALGERLWSVSIDPERALLEWMQALAGRAPARLLASKASFQYFAAAAPGARELVCMVKIWRLTGGDGEGEPPYDLVVLDAPATGHALAMLDSPQTFASIARVGPVASQAEAVRAMLTDAERTGYLAVAQAGEMSVTETLELRAELRDRLGVELSSVVVNATMHRRFTGEELTRIEALRGESSLSTQVRVAHAAAAAAQAAHLRTRFQHGQLKRLRKEGLTVLQVPFLFQPDLDLEALRRIAERLEQRL